jgi:sorbitol-specific phosphotransferase system component IIA
MRDLLTEVGSIVPSDFSDSILMIFTCNASNQLWECSNILKTNSQQINPWERLRDDRLFVLKLLVRTEGT